MVVASNIEGRVRVRDEGLKCETLLERAREVLGGTPGVESVEANRRVGSLLIVYNAAVSAVGKILKTLSDLLGSAVKPQERSQAATAPFFPRFRLRSLSDRMPLPLSTSARKKILNWGMLAAFLLSITAALFDLKKLHILTGMIFAALVGDHVYQRKAQMFA